MPPEAAVVKCSAADPHVETHYIYKERSNYI